MEWSQRSAIVTGGAGGLGAATVRRLSALGLRVVVFDRALEAGTALAADIGTGAAVGGDINNDADVLAAVDAASGLAPLAVLVNVAGGGAGGRTLSRDNSPVGIEGFQSTIDLNAVGTFNVTRLGAARMAGNDPDEFGQRGVVVNTASIAGYEGQTGQVAYAAAKAAILGMSLPLARDLAPVGIRVCAIAPGTMGTPLMRSAPEELQRKLEENIVFPKRMGEPDEFAMLVESIVVNPYLNGENIRLDGALRFPPEVSRGGPPQRMAPASLWAMIWSQSSPSSRRISSVCWPCSGARVSWSAVSSICTGLATRSKLIPSVPLDGGQVPVGTDLGIVDQLARHLARRPRAGQGGQRLLPLGEGLGGEHLVDDLDALLRVREAGRRRRRSGGR